MRINDENLGPWTKKQWAMAVMTTATTTMMVIFEDHDGSSGGGGDDDNGEVIVCSSRSLARAHNSVSGGHTQVYIMVT